MAKKKSREDNLIPNSERTPKERQEIARAGGIASGEARRARKTLREELLALLAAGNTQERISLAMIEKAATGSERAFEVIRDTIGEKPSDELRLEGGVKFLFDGAGGDDYSG